MKQKVRLIIVTVACTTFFWIAVAVGFICFAFNGDAGAEITFTRPGEMEVISGTYRVGVVTSNGPASSLLFSHTAHAPERVSFTVERLETRTAQR